MKIVIVLAQKAFLAPGPGILLSPFVGGTGNREDEVVEPLDVMKDERENATEFAEVDRLNVLVEGTDEVRSTPATKLGPDTLLPRVADAPNPAGGRCGPVLVVVTRETGLEDCTSMIGDSIGLKRGAFAVSGTRRAPPMRPVVAKLLDLTGVGFAEADTDSRLKL